MGPQSWVNLRGYFRLFHRGGKVQLLWSAFNPEAQHTVKFTLSGAKTHSLISVKCIIFHHHGTVTVCLLARFVATIIKPHRCQSISGRGRNRGNSSFIPRDWTSERRETSLVLILVASVHCAPRTDRQKVKYLHRQWGRGEYEWTRGTDLTDFTDQKGGGYRPHPKSSRHILVEQYAVKRGSALLLERYPESTYQREIQCAFLCFTHNHNITTERMEWMSHRKWKEIR